MHRTIHLLHFTSYLVLDLLCCLFCLFCTPHPVQRATIFHSQSLLEVYITLYTSNKSHGVCNRNEYPSRTAIILAVWSLNLSPESYFPVHNSTTDTVTMPIDPKSDVLCFGYALCMMRWLWNAFYGIPWPQNIVQSSVFGPVVPLLLLQKCAWSGPNMRNMYNLGILAVCIWWMNVLDQWRDLAMAHMWFCNGKYSCSRYYAVFFGVYTSRELCDDM